MKYYYWDMRYVPLSDSKRVEFKKYFSENRSKFMLIDTNLYIDTVALERKFSCCDGVCDCCTKLEGENPSDIFNKPDRLISMNGYCCDGGCMISKDFISSTNKYLGDVVQYLPNDSQSFIRTLGFYDSFVVGNKVYFKTNTMKDGRCVFATYKDGKKGCALHQYANDKGLDIFEVKPFDCSLFPLDILIDDGVYYMTAVTEDNSYCRFNKDNTPIKLSCITQKNDGVPLYRFSKDLIIDIFGELVYDIIEAYFIEREGEMHNGSVQSD